MKIIVDTNVVVAAVLKDSITRRILLYPRISYYSPEFMLTEFSLHKNEIMHKTHLTKNSFPTIQNLVFSNLKIVQKLNYNHYMKAAEEIVGNIDRNDVQYFALSLAISADGIWSYDKRLTKQGRVRIFNTSEMFQLVKSRYPGKQ